MTLNKSNIDYWTDNYDFKKYVLAQRKSRQELEDTEENKLFKLCEKIYLKFNLFIYNFLGSRVVE